jgi:tRNA pseudouridine32 synthase/23S rRNA pseudouridine746 synthase
MTNPLPTATAEAYCLKLQYDLDGYRCLDFESDQKISTDYLFGPARGQMFGILVCVDCTGAEVVLKAFSGQYDGRWLIPGWVPPVCDPERFAQVVGSGDVQIKSFTTLLAEVLECDEEQSMEKLEYQLRGQSGDQLVDHLSEKRKSLSRQMQRRIHGLYQFRCLDQSIRTISEIFGSESPPTGTGDCCAPKLLHFAFSRGLHPVSMAEFFYGSPNRSGTREHGHFYPPCDDKCKPVLAHMLGLDILYRDNAMLVVNKPSGLLSVPGRGPAMQDSVETRMRLLFPDCIVQPAVHRLDMDTSGLLVLAFTAAAHRDLGMQFMKGDVHKEYVGLLEGVIEQEGGVIELPFRLDTDNRPYQIYDEEQGKLGKTIWKKLRVEYFQGDRLATRVRFTPLTGRTHQLRLHSAHEKGLGHSIIGDRLYGVAEEGQRLMLHACLLTCTHAVTKEPLTFTCEVNF